jgi:hypothetical protein
VWRVGPICLKAPTDSIRESCVLCQCNACASAIAAHGEAGLGAQHRVCPEVHARVRQAKHTHVSRLQEIKQVRTEVQQAVVAAWSQLQAARGQLQSDTLQVVSNRTALAGVREEEKVGQRTLLDILNAEQELLNSEVALVTTRRNLVVAAYSVLSTTGKLGMGQAGKLDDLNALRPWHALGVPRMSVYRIKDETAKPRGRAIGLSA